MDRGMSWRVSAIVGPLLVALVVLMPNFVSELPDWWKSVFPTQPVSLGLDLRGGIHLVLEVQSDKAVENSIDMTIEQLRREAREKEIATRDWKRDGMDALSFAVVGDAKRGEMEKLVSDTYPNLQPLPGSGSDGRLQYHLAKQEVEGIKSLAIEQALETVRNRIDEFGVAEPTIQRTGTDGILVQLPGIQDAERAKRLIGRTAQLRFQLVANDPNAPGVQKLSGSEVDPVTKRPSATTYNVEPTVLMTGEVISDARHRPGQMGEAPYVAITLNTQGASVFDRITADSVGRRMAIVLDGKVQSAPVIRERIGGGRAVITGNFTLDEARDLAIVLRAGALPAPVVVAEERTVGPSLGRDSITAGTQSFLLGGIVVMLFMGTYYRAAGLIADVAMIFNVVLIVASMVLFHGTLTLPGIAGIVLTMGMAVDANVLINERIREELRGGKTAHAALDAGYSKALPAILDSNITTFLSGIILFQFGSGPVKGFAVTLCIGIVMTIYTAVYVSRVLHDLVVGTKPAARLSI